MGRQRPTPNNPVMYRLFARSCFERRKAGFHRRWRNSHLAPSERSPPPLLPADLSTCRNLSRVRYEFSAPLILPRYCSTNVQSVYSWKNLFFFSFFTIRSRANRWNLLVVNSNSAASLIIIYFEWTRFNPVIYLGHKLTRLTITVTPD